MNDDRALFALRLETIEDIDDENEWAEILTTQVNFIYMKKLENNLFIFSFSDVQFNQKS